jgi:hypothetical protein
MSAEQEPPSRPLALAAMALAIIVTAAFAVALVRFYMRWQQNLITRASDAPAMRCDLDGPIHLLAGADMRLSSRNDQSTIERRVASADFVLGPGESLDAPSSQCVSGHTMCPRRDWARPFRMVRS